VRLALETMGTVASLELPGPEFLAVVSRVFDDAEELFSLYRPDSELSRIARGELALTDADSRLREAYTSAHEWSSLTDGAFTANRPDGTLDLNGIVKARAIADATTALVAQGISDFSINVGGDVLCTGLDPETWEEWAIGIANPADRSSILCAITLREPRCAVATSGSTERGDHIWGTGLSTESQFAQVTVVANDIVTADVLATAIVAGGRPMLDQASARWDIDVIAIDRKGDMVATPGLRSALAV
jgi:FAD:protein FMN transferase